MVSAVSASPAVSAQAHPMFDVALGGGGLSRHLAYHQDLHGDFAPYNLTLAPAVVGHVAVYPLAGTELTVLRDLGLVVDGDVTLGVTSRTPTGATRDTSFWGVGAGLRGRVVYDGGEVGFSARWLLQSFGLTGTNDPMGPFVPSITYQGVHAGADLRHALSTRFSLTAAAGWFLVLDAGELTETYFRRATLHAGDVGIGAVIGLGDAFEARINLNARRYFHAMNPEPGDSYIVGGALDHVFTGTVLIAWRR
jgi:hypothetical protein